MTIELQIQPQTNGELRLRFFDDETGTVSRRSIVPGRFVDGAWLDVDLSGEVEEIQIAAVALWTPEIVDAWKLANPWEETPSPSAPAENGRALEIRQRQAAKQEASALMKRGDMQAAFEKLLELIPE